MYHPFSITVLFFCHSDVRTDKASNIKKKFSTMSLPFISPFFFLPSLYPSPSDGIVEKEDEKFLRLFW